LPGSSYRWDKKYSAIFPPSLGGKIKMRELLKFKRG